MYNPLHEASVDKTLEVFKEIINREAEFSRLQKMRKNQNMTQKELSINSGVNLRTLQQYECNDKDINKASVITVMNLAKALKCSINDIINIKV